MMYSSEGSLFSKQKLKLSFTKGHSISLAKGLQQDRFLPSCREKQLNPASAISQIKILSKQGRSALLHLCKFQGERSQEVLFSLMVKNLEHLLFTFQFRIQNAQGALEWYNSSAAQTMLPLGCSPTARHSGQEFVLAKDTSIQQLSVLWQFTEQVNGPSQNSVNQIPHHIHGEGKERAKSW